MYIGTRVAIENSIWEKANGKTGIVKNIFNVNSDEDCILIKFDDQEVNHASSEVGGFTFRYKDLKMI